MESLWADTGLYSELYKNHKSKCYVSISQLAVKALHWLKLPYHRSEKPPYLDWPFIHHCLFSICWQTFAPSKEKLKRTSNRNSSQGWSTKGIDLRYHLNCICALDRRLDWTRSRSSMMCLFQRTSRQKHLKAACIVKHPVPQSLKVSSIKQDSSMQSATFSSTHSLNLVILTLLSKCSRVSSTSTCDQTPTRRATATGFTSRSGANQTSKGAFPQPSTSSTFSTCTKRKCCTGKRPHP